MAGYIKSNVKRKNTTSINQQINKEVFDEFKDYCRATGYPMNVLIETFMQQYANGNFHMSSDEINKWKKDDSETDILNTTFNKEIYLKFKSACKRNGYFIRYTITAFMAKFINSNFVLEFVEMPQDNK